MKPVTRRNLPGAAVSLAVGQPVACMTDYRPGTMFTRISLDLIAELSDFQQLTTVGELVRASGEETNR